MATAMEEGGTNQALGIEITSPSLVSLQALNAALRGLGQAPASEADLAPMIIAMVLSPFEPWYVPVATSTFAIASKHLIRTKAANVFNPAGLALVVSYYVFDSGQSWWGALPDLAPWAITALLSPASSPRTA